MKSTKKKEQLPAARCDLHSSRSAIPSVCDKDFGLHHHSLPSVPPLFLVNPAHAKHGSWIFVNVNESTALRRIDFMKILSTALTVTLPLFFVNPVLTKCEAWNNPQLIQFVAQCIICVFTVYVESELSQFPKTGNHLCFFLHPPARGDLQRNTILKLVLRL